MRAQADDDGLVVPSRLSGSYDVVFDGTAVWTVALDGGSRLGRRVRVGWPKAMRPWLDGTAEVSLRPSVGGGTEITVGEVTFGSGDGRVEFVDGQGRPVVIDKWGIVQRPFSTRGDEVTAELAEQTGHVIDVIREELGLECWMAFGTLLGAARAGKAIGHDSDSDVLYLSEKTTPAEINVEAYAIKRALTRRGLRAVIKSGSFVTVLVPGSDGAPIGIDVYACFYVDGVLHETATLRSPIPREAILPLGTMPFEGRELPAPADPDALLAASYGPGWRVPDPSFRHTPDHGTVTRFDGWFGNMMTQRRVWEAWWRDHQALGPASPLALRILEDCPDPVSVLEIGAGNGNDAVRLAEAGHRVQAFDYARRSFREAGKLADRRDLSVSFGLSNLYDVRDTMTLAALQLHRPRPPSVVLARSVVDALRPRGRDSFWRLVSTTLRGGGRAYLEFTSEPDPDAGAGGERPPVHPTTRQSVRRQVEARGGRVVLAEPVGESSVAAWHVVAEWS